MTNIIDTNFVKPTPKPELGGELGLYASEIAKSLGVRVSALRQKLRTRGLLEELEENKLTRVTFVTSNDSNGLQKEEYAFSVEASKYIVARWRNKIGNGYLTFLVKLESKVSELEKLANSDPLLANILNIANVRKEQLMQKEEIEKIKNKVDATPQMVKSEIDKAFETKGEFPPDCMRIDDICSEFFHGIAKKKVCAWLKYLGHPRGNHVHRDEFGSFPSRPYKIEGLKEAGDKLRKECTELEPTEKLYRYHHKAVGYFQVRKDVLQRGLKLLKSI